MLIVGEIVVSWTDHLRDEHGLAGDALAEADLADVEAVVALAASEGFREELLVRRGRAVRSMAVLPLPSGPRRLSWMWAWGCRWGAERVSVEHPPWPASDPGTGA